MGTSDFLVMIALFFYILVPSGVLGIAEYFLAKLESPWPGRVLPILSAAFSLCVSGLTLFNLIGETPYPILLVPILILVLFNIPTAVFLIVYRNTRRQYAERRKMDRQDLQDL